MKRAVKKGILAGEILCTGYLSLLGVMLPLTVHDAYFDITRTKAAVFWVLSGLLVLSAVLWLCLDKEGRRTLTPLSPVGEAEIEGERREVLSDSGYIPSGESVVVLRTEGKKIVVVKA